MFGVDTSLIVAIITLIAAFVGGGVVEHETKVVTKVIMYPVDLNTSHCRDLRSDYGVTAP